MKNVTKNGVCVAQNYGPVKRGVRGMVIIVILKVNDRSDRIKRSKRQRRQLVLLGPGAFNLTMCADIIFSTNILKYTNTVQIFYGQW